MTFNTEQMGKKWISVLVTLYESFARQLKFRWPSGSSNMYLWLKFQVCIVFHSGDMRRRSSRKSWFLFKLRSPYHLKHSTVRAKIHGMYEHSWVFMYIQFQIEWVLICAFSEGFKIVSRKSEFHSAVSSKTWIKNERFNIFRSPWNKVHQTLIYIACLRVRQLGEYRLSTFRRGWRGMAHLLLYHPNGIHEAEAIEDLHEISSFLMRDQRP